MANQGTQTFSTFNDLRKQTGSSNAAVKVLGKDAPSDSFGGIFYYNSSSTSPDDNLNIIQPTGVLTGRWLRLSLSSNSINIGNSDLSLTNQRHLDLNGFALLIDGGDLVDIDTTSGVYIKGGVVILRSTINNSIVLAGGSINSPAVGLNFSNITNTRDIKIPDEDGTIALDKYSVFSLVSDSNGVLQSISLIGRNICLIHGGSVFFESDYQFYKPINGDTILDKSTQNDPSPSPYIFLPNQKYYLTPIKP
jgi:hypothetical protein